MTRGDIYHFVLDPTVGSETRKTRPCVVVMNDPRGASPVTIVCPISDANGRPGNLLNPAVAAGVGGLSKDSRVSCDHVRTLDKARTRAHLGTLPTSVMLEVDRGLRAILGL